MIGPFLNLTAVVGPNGGGKLYHTLLYEYLYRKIEHIGCYRICPSPQTHLQETQTSEGTHIPRGAREISRK